MQHVTVVDNRVGCHVSRVMHDVPAFITIQVIRTSEVNVGFLWRALTDLEVKSRVFLEQDLLGALDVILDCLFFLHRHYPRILRMKSFATRRELRACPWPTTSFP